MKRDYANFDPADTARPFSRPFSPEGRANYNAIDWGDDWWPVRQFRSGAWERVFKTRKVYGPHRAPEPEPAAAPVLAPQPIPRC